MDADRWRRLQALFLEVRSAPAGERDGLLAERCAGDDELLAELRTLLAADAADGVLDSLVPRIVESLAHVLTETIPAQIGAYRVLREIGRGGMGVVYLAERADGQYEQHVAIKVIAPTDAHDPLQQRVLAERQILAGLSHPNIARLLDAGITGNGRPYLVLEYVDGVPVTTYCDRHRLGVAERLRLFLDICAAVHHAHTRLVIHRDIKPSNILVGTDGRVHLLDFGIAKLLEQPSAAGPAPVTRTGLRALTPEYASPEQVRGDPITTVSDIYSLGVLLYELLCGSPPYELSTRSPMELAEAVCRQDPERPSVRAARAVAGAQHDLSAATPEHRAAARSTQVHRLSSQLRGDLDSIVLMAMRKEPALRYASVAALRDDLARHLAGRTVLAHRGGGRYRLRKLVLRHRAAVTAGALAMIALAAGSAVASWQAVVAGRERDRAASALAQSEELTSFLMELFRSGETDDVGPQRDVSAADLLQRAAARVDELADRPLVQARLLDVIGRMSLDLGRYEDAQRLLENAVAIRRAPGERTSLDLAESLIHLAWVQRALARYDSAHSLVTEAVRIRRISLPPDEPALAAGVYELGLLTAGPDQERLYREALGILQTSEAAPEQQVTLMQALSTNLRRQGRLDEAVAADREAVRLAERAFGADHFRTGEALIHLGDQVTDLEADHAGAEALYRRGLALIERQFGESSLRLIHGLHSLGRLHAFTDRHADAERLFRRSLAIRVAATGPDHPLVADEMRVLAEQLARQGELDAAESMILDASDRSRRASGANDRAVARSLAVLAEVQYQQGRYGDVDRTYEEVLALNANRGVLLAEAHRDYGRLLLRQHRHQSAEQQLMSALEMMVDIYAGGEHPNVIETKRALMDLYGDWGRPGMVERFRVPPGRHVLY